MPVGVALTPGEAVTVGVRPDAITLADPNAADPAGRVAVVEHLGGETIVYVAIDGIPDLISVQVQGKVDRRVDEAVSLCIERERCHVFAADGSALTGGVHA